LIISNIHERKFPFSAAIVGALIDTLATKNDLLWPIHLWPAMHFNRHLSIGAQGGHGPIRYTVEAYEPGRSICFYIHRPPCLKNALHRFEVSSETDGQSTLRHILELDFSGRALLSWPLVWKPLHDACIEDALTCAQVALGLAPTIRPWSFWVRSLRLLISGGKAPAQKYSINDASTIKERIIP